MADDPKGTKKELSMEMRLLLAFGLMGIVLFATQYLMPKTPVKPATPPVEQAQQSAKPPAASPATPTPKPAAANAAATASGKKNAEAAPVAAVAAQAEETRIIDTSVYRILFTNKGASIRSWVLKNYKDINGKQIELIDPRKGGAFSYYYYTPPTGTNLNDVLFTVKQATPSSIEFEYSDGATTARKSFEFDAKSYRSIYSSEVSKDGKPVQHQLAWRGGFGDRTFHNALDVQHSVYYLAAKSKLVTATASDAAKGAIPTEGEFHFGGMEDTYFAGVLLPEPGSSVSFYTIHDKFPLAEGGEEKEHVGIAFGGQGINRSALFVGPKDTDILRSTDRKLETMIDWGWFEIMAKPLFLALNWVNDKITHNWGWAIILATVVINILLLPLRFSQIKSSQKMAAIQPEMQAIQGKYKDLSARDPKKQKQNEELMELYKKHGINPMGGCVPLLLQMPFFIAFFKVLSVAIELRGANWMWVQDLSQPETIPIRLLPVGMLVTQVLMQKMTPVASPDPSQQKLMMIMMPVMMTVMFYGASSGLVLYWLTGNVVGIVQQYFFNKYGSKPTLAQASISKKK
ncbi:MAG: membrane protein insertase YidC [Bryobacterales bacterium]|nr:membrane protein insertase YidC [Bryobacterales bacterium]